jgi:hypothetical protein
MKKPNPQRFLNPFWEKISNYQKEYDLFPTHKTKILYRYEEKKKKWIKAENQRRIDKDSITLDKPMKDGYNFWMVKIRDEKIIIRFPDWDEQYSGHTCEKAIQQVANKNFSINYPEIDTNGKFEADYVFFDRGESKPQEIVNWFDNELGNFYFLVKYYEAEHYKVTPQYVEVTSFIYEDRSPCHSNGTFKTGCSNDNFSSLGDSWHDKYGPA